MYTERKERWTNMAKKNSFILIISIVFVLIINWLSTIPTFFKVLLSTVSIAFLFPNVRELVLKERFRKLKVAFYTAVTYTFGTVIYSMFEYNSNVLAFVIPLFFFTVIGVYTYGLLASVFAEFISIRFPKVRFWLSGLIHIGLGMLTSFLPAVICSALFFLYDELTRRKYVEAI